MNLKNLQHKKIIACTSLVELPYGNAPFQSRKLLEHLWMKRKGSYFHYNPFFLLEQFYKNRSLKIGQNWRNRTAYTLLI